MSATTELPIPEQLPVPWEQPGDEQGFWTMDRMHFPMPVPRLEDEFLIRTIYHDGLNYAAELYAMPIRAHARRFWAHHYMAIAPLPLSHEEEEALGREAEARLQEAVGTLAHRWYNEWLPEVQGTIAELEAVDLSEATPAALVAAFDRLLAQMRRLWQIHFATVIPAMLALSLFDEMYRDLFETESSLEALQLLEGLENTTVTAGRDLWRISRRIVAEPRLRAVFEEQAATEIIPTLTELAEGRALLEDLRGYLDEHGRRGEIWSIRYPTWREDPTPVIRTLKDYVAQPERDMELEQAGQIAARDQTIAAARERLAGYPEAAREQFEFLLLAGQNGNIISEDHGYWIDFRGLAGARGVLLQMADRLVAVGSLEQRDDIFHLTVDELHAALEQLDGVDYRERVAERKQELDTYAVEQLPPAVGIAPPGPPPDNPMMRALGKFFGAPPQPPTEPNVLRGAAGSAGIARGRARVARSLSDTHGIQPGDILVAETTAPPWTPLFGTVAAVVTDTGGVLSHCAVVAREYRIPAVVGVGMATAMIRNGQMVEVDGSNGIVRILDEG